jgi:GTP-binding protein EngB required for normal cell division
MTPVPEFAIVGHPNEGKSSVLSTLSEDDSVRVSPIPGETTQCRTFPVIIDGQEVIRFIDTPGFQNPRKTLAWMRAYQGEDRDMLPEFIKSHAHLQDLRDDCALLRPLVEGAGIIFVVDGSRPLRNIDRAEMEILRLTARPRMAVINCKEEESTFLADWHNEFRKHFNAIRLFNANKATYSQRIALLNSLKAIDQELETVIEQVIQAFIQDWQNRRRQTAEIILALLKETLLYHKRTPCPPGSNEEELKSQLHQTYTDFVSTRERAAQQQIRRLFKHNLYDFQLPEQSILQQDLFSAKTWDFLGLSRRELAMAGALSGAAMGVWADALSAGLSMGIFTALGGAMGAAGVALKGKDLLTGKRLLGMKLDKEQIQVGPVQNIQLLYILLDRALLYYSHIVHRAHGRRDQTPDNSMQKLGLTSTWSSDERKICQRFFQALQHKETSPVQEETAEKLLDLIHATLEAMSKKME